MSTRRPASGSVDCTIWTNTGVFFISMMIGAEFVRKEDMAAQIPALVESLKDFVATDKTDFNLLISHDWDAALLGVKYDRGRTEPLPHVWIPYSLGAVKKRNMPPEQWPNLRIDERIAIERNLISQLDGIAATSSHHPEVAPR